MSDQSKLQEFVRDALPDAWLSYAEELSNSADLLWEREAESFRLEMTANAELQPIGSRRVSRISRTYMLLAGFALENLIKGLLVAQDPSNVNTGHLSKDLKSHDILNLASKVEHLALSRDERTFCGNVSRAIPYWGRYPIPLDKNEVTPDVALTEEMRHTYIALFERLAHQLYWTFRDGWDSGVGPQTIKARDSKYDGRIDPNESLF
jgi:hypothetical protein